MRDKTHTPQQALWQAVLYRQVEDATFTVAEGGDYKTRLRTCQEARSFLTRPSRDLSIICNNAGMDMQAVIEAMTKRIAEAPSPEDIASATTETRRKGVKKERKPRATPFKDRTYTINGVTRTAQEWADRFNINLNRVQVRLSRGWSTEQAFTITREQAQAEVARTRRKHTEREYKYTQSNRKRQQSIRAARASTSAPTYEYNGKNLTLKQWSDRTGIAKGTLYKRIAINGWSVAEALETPIAPRNKRAKKI